MTEQEQTGIVFGIQRFSIHDGPGIRTTVFLKGCNVACRWCHNPEGIPLQPLLSYDVQKCTACGACASVCPNGCHEFKGGVHHLERASCALCGACVRACPNGALSQIGEVMTVGEVFAKVLRDRRYYGAEGGVTLSGGEAMLQKAFAGALLRACHGAGLHCALETNGLHPLADYLEILPCVDLFLFDYKATDARVHREYVGCDNAPILRTLRALYEAGANILLRCPIIPGVNDNAGHFDAIAALTRQMPNLVGAELLPYHKLGVAKARRIGAEAEEFPTPPAQTVADWKRYILEQGGRLVNVD